MPGTLTDADIAAHEPQAPTTLTDADIAAHEAPQGIHSGLATKLGRPAVANNASPQDQAFVNTALSDQSIPHPILTGLAHGAADTAGTLVGGLLGDISPAELMGTRPGQILTKLLSHPKVVKAAKDAAMEWADTIPGVKAARKTADAAKTAYGVAKDVFSPEAESLDTSALPVHGGVEGTPTDPLMARVKQSMADIQAQPQANMDDTLASMKQKLGARDVPASQDRYDVGSGAPVMKAKSAKAAAGGSSLEDQLSASVDKARASKAAAENYKPGDTVWLPNRGHVLIKKINPDGTFDYATSK